MGLGKEETPPPGPFPALPHCLGLSLGVTRNPSSLLLVGDLMRSPSPPSLPQPRHVDVTQISLQKILFF